jgi:phage N-6-adenine-methyltransferase
MKRKMPRQKPATSEQTVCTPLEFIAAVERRFGLITCDLAATRENAVHPNFLGPGSKYSEDALSVSWQGPAGPVLWLNPPYSRCADFAKKAAEEGAKGARVHMLVPASVGSNWFADHVHGKALVLALRPRLTFVGHRWPFPKDLLLCVYGPFVVPGFGLWKWNGE